MKFNSGPQNRADVSFVGNGNTEAIFGGALLAWSPVASIDPANWFQEFRSNCIGSIGKRFLPVYRLADGEFAFLLGHQPRQKNSSLIRGYARFLKSRLLPMKTCWGEKYPWVERKLLVAKLKSEIMQIANVGILAPFLYETPLGVCAEFEVPILKLLQQLKIELSVRNYVPFHFPVNLLVASGWNDFFREKNILFCTSVDEKSQFAIRSHLHRVGARSVEFLEVSKNQSIKQNLDLNPVRETPDICFVAAGIGSANILLQLRSFNTLALDIGAFIHCLDKSLASCHGGVFALPMMNCTG